MRTPRVPTNNGVKTMLVLSRKERQQIVIDERITVTVVKLKGGVVRIGVEADASVPVRRAELPPKVRAA